MTRPPRWCGTVGHRQMRDGSDRPARMVGAGEPKGRCDSVRCCIVLPHIDLRHVRTSDGSRPAQSPAASRDTSFIAPRSPTEHQIATIWEELFGVSPIGANDNYFDLGGD